MSELRELIKNKKRIVVKIGSSSLQHPETGDLDYTKMEVLVRELCNMINSGRSICETGLCCNRTGPSHDDLPENFC